MTHYSPKPRIMAQNWCSRFMKIFWRIMTLSVDWEIFFEIYQFSGAVFGFGGFWGYNGRFFFIFWCHSAVWHSVQLPRAIGDWSYKTGSEVKSRSASLFAKTPNYGSKLLGPFYEDFLAYYDPVCGFGNFFWNLTTFRRARGAERPKIAPFLFSADF